jgi:tRNA A37 N6-isopentenylltransferase MiaA
MKRRTRNYARRQVTWMRKLAGVTVIDTAEMTATVAADKVLELWLSDTGKGREVHTLPRR